MRYRNNQRNMSHAFATHFFLGYLNTTTVANDSFVTDTFVFTAVTLIILNRSEDSFAEQTIAFRFISPVIYRFRFQNFSVRTFKNFFRRGQTDTNFGKATFNFIVFSECHISIVILTNLYQENRTDLPQINPG